MEILVTACKLLNVYLSVAFVWFCISMLTDWFKKTHATFLTKQANLSAIIFRLSGALFRGF